MSLAQNRCSEPQSPNRSKLGGEPSIQAVSLRMGEGTGQGHRDTATSCHPHGWLCAEQAWARKHDRHRCPVSGSCLHPSSPHPSPSTHTHLPESSRSPTCCSERGCHVHACVCVCQTILHRGTRQCSPAARAPGTLPRMVPPALVCQPPVGTCWPCSRRCAACCKLLLHICSHVCWYGREK